MLETGKLCMGLDGRGRDWGSGPSQQSTLRAHMCSGVSMDTEMPNTMGTGIFGRPNSASFHPSPILMYQRLTQEQDLGKSWGQLQLFGTSFQMRL